MRDNIVKFINNAATQITGEASNDGPGEKGFYTGKEYVAFDEDGNPMFKFVIGEDGSWGAYDIGYTSGEWIWSGYDGGGPGGITNKDEASWYLGVNFSDDGKTASTGYMTYYLQE